MIDEILGYKFKNRQFLQEALTHPSICAKDKSISSYERLEFLGDSVLSLIIISYIIDKFSNENEGKLAKRKAALVDGETLAKIGTSVGIGMKIIMSDSEVKLGGRENPHNIENALEAVIGAIYLDGGIEEAKRIVINLWEPYIVEMKEVPTDPKSKLQEDLQKRGLPLPKYELVEQGGPGHMLEFKVRIIVPGFKEATGIGKSKQAAEKEAAISMLSQIHKLS